MDTLVAPNLLPHGTYVAPDHAPQHGTTEALAGRSPEQARQPGFETIKQRLSRNEYMGWDPRAMGCIKAIYPEAIEYRRQTSVEAIGQSLRPGGGYATDIDPYF